MNGEILLREIEVLKALLGQEGRKERWEVLGLLQGTQWMASLAQEAKKAIEDFLELVGCPEEMLRYHKRVKKVRNLIQVDLGQIIS